MKNFSEFFEFLSHCNQQTIIDELKKHGNRILDTKKDNPYILIGLTLKG